MLSRRSFFIGVAATAAVLKIPSSSIARGVVNEPSKLLIARGFERARLFDMTFSSCPGDDFGEPPKDGYVSYTIHRIKGEHPLFSIGMNARATYRWVSAPGAEYVVTKDSPIRLDIEPCHSNTNITLAYDVRENYGDRPIVYTEAFRTKDGKVLFHEINAVDLDNIVMDEDEDLGW